MSVSRMFLIGAIVLALYAGFVVESASGQRTIAPHVPFALMLAAIWLLPPSPAVLASAMIGLGCDAIRTGPTGPGMIVAALAALIAVRCRTTWKLTSPASFFLLGAPCVAMTLWCEQAGQTLLRGQSMNPDALTAIALGRGMATALVALGPLLAARSATALRRLFSLL